MGLDGKSITIVKFRSMYDDAEADTGPVWARENDPRVTPLGGFLRRSSLDELPQLWNVLRGEMSLVGPRPPVPSEVALYEEHHFARFDMKPGMTGPWQVNGRNRVTSFEEVVRLEREYVRRWSIWKDVTLLLRTVPAVVRMRGAH
jgi:lipopolysaccharide/colanic/teichoic acid biosynthesis glycosyltransferase